MTKNIICRLENVLFEISPYENLDSESISELNSLLEAIKSENEEMFAHKVFVKDILKQELYKRKKSYLTTKAVDEAFIALTTINNDVYTILKRLSRNYDIYGVSNSSPIINDYRSYFFNLDSLMIAIFNPVNIDFKPYESLLIDFDDAVIKRAISLGYRAHHYKNLADFKDFINQNTNFNTNNEITS